MKTKFTDGFNPTKNSSSRQYVKERGDFDHAIFLKLKIGISL